MINLNKKDPIADAVKEILQQEALKGNQHKIDKNKNNKIDSEDFKILRKEETVDEALKGNQHKIDKNKNNKIDSEDFKILRKEETVDEGIIKNVAKKAFKALTGGSDEDQLKALQKRTGVPVTGKKPEPKNEEVEQLDELKKSTVKSYIGKKMDQIHDAGNRMPSMSRVRKDTKALQRAHDRNTGVKPTSEEVGVREPKTLRQFKEGWDDMMKAVKERNKPQPNGGSGVKQGSRYGGSKQKDEPEKDTDEKK